MEQSEIERIADRILKRVWNNLSPIQLRDKPPPTLDTKSGILEVLMEELKEK